MSDQPIPQEQPQAKQIQIGTNLGGEEKYVLGLLMKIDYLNGQNAQLYNDLMKARQQLAMMAKDRDAMVARMNNLEATVKSFSEDKKDNPVPVEVNLEEGDIEETVVKTTDVKR